MRSLPGTDDLLVLRALNLGDLLVAVPALRALRRARPDHHLVLATRPELAPVAALTGAVDELLPTDGPAALRWTRPVPPKLAVNLHGTGPQSHRALDGVRPGQRIAFRGAGWDGPEWNDVAGRHPHERERWCALLAESGIPADPADLTLPAPPPSGWTATPPVLVHPGARYGAKRWPADRFAAVTAELEGAGRPVLLTGSADERPLVRAVAAGAGLPQQRVLAGRTDLARLCALVAGAALVVSGDTGIAHLASAFGTPSVVLFGPVDPAQWGPPGNGPHRVLTDAGARRGDPFAADPDPALLSIDVEDVLRAAREVCAMRRST
ncbi:glycosyltransferase family 9 protein [Pseudonocardia bannensis]|uniref:Glycosyltransferase family 9 protein n=1 Tax=Pseudonocardia bannensis TaxID=630973 RepID=A0A848DBX7_9PSEU|nr:glycosyltransferase family 9 protein [Pseudonocardia bannensis]NMH90011.1 glycosyltransferase family 9 protein [Pseudonocardia bannensis]